MVPCKDSENGISFFQQPFTNTGLTHDFSFVDFCNNSAQALMKWTFFEKAVAYSHSIVAGGFPEMS